MPENLSSLTNEQIESRISEIVSEFSALGLSIDSSEDDIAKGEALGDEMRALRAEKQNRTDRQSRLSALDETFCDNPVPLEESVEEQPETDEAEEETEKEPEPVAASAKPSPARRAAALAPEVKMPKPASQVAISAAADVPNYSAGQRFDDLTAAADAIISRAHSLPTHFAANTRLRYGALKIQKQGFGDLVQDGYYSDYDLIQRAGSEKRLSGGSRALTADAWCAPSDTMYDMCQYETVSGLLSIPEFQVTRGGIRYTTGPDFSDIYSDPNFYFHVTNNNVITDGAGTVVTSKPCGTITCPTFTEVRLEVDGVCISVDILSNVGYPELTRRITEGVLVAHQRKMNVANIAAIEAAAGAAVVVPENTTLLFNLDYLEWYITAMRDVYSLADNATIEVVAPTWLRPLVRAELARRNGVDYVNTTDQFINTFFSVRGASMTFVRDWQPLTGTPGAVAIPTTVDLLLYPAGSWTRGTQGVISLDTIYDSTLLAENKYLALFTEEASLLVQKCLGTTRLQMTTPVSGLTGAQITETLGVAVP